MSESQRDAMISADVLNEMTIQYWNAGPAQRESFPDGTHEKDGGTFSIKDGRIVSLTTSTGNHFTDIRHDAAGEVLSMQTSDGYAWEQHNIVGPDGMLKRHGYVLKLSNLSLHYDRLVVNSHGVTFLKSGKPGYVNTTTTGGAKGTMSVSAEGPMSGLQHLTAKRKTVQSRTRSHSVFNQITVDASRLTAPLHQRLASFCGSAASV